jgi:hypothetical protein
MFFVSKKHSIKEVDEIENACYTIRMAFSVTKVKQNKTVTE